MASDRWRAPDLSTGDPAAVAHYVRAVASLVAGAAHAGARFEAAVASDPLFALAHVGMAVVTWCDVVIPSGSPTTLGERQHVEIARAWVRGDIVRATDLRREHLLEYPGDLVVVVLPFVARVVS